MQEVLDEWEVSNPGSLVVRRRPVSPPILILAFVTWFCVDQLLRYLVHPRIGSLSKVWYLDTLIELLSVDLLLVVLRPDFLLLSRWRVGLRPFGISTSVGLLFQSAGLMLGYLQNQGSGWLYVFCLVIVSPILEEVLMRGALLRSLLDRLPSWLAIGIVSCTAAFLHEFFLTAFLAQCVLGLIYVRFRYSIGASIICHMTMNLVICCAQLHLVKQ